jgi:hypothetical protein
MKYLPLARVENLIRRVVEEPFTWLGGSSLDPFQLASHLTRQYEHAGARDEVPTRFTVYVSPDDLAEIERELPAFQQQVADYVVLMARRRGFDVKEPPAVRIEARPEETARSAHVVAHFYTPGNPSETAILAAGDSGAIHEAIRAADAFLIVQGRQHIALDQPVMRIGRRVDNDIVLDAPSISRQHAQIRWRQRYFVLYDVSGQGRTSVNGARVQEHVLRPGDVIALSDILLVYGEGRDAPGAVNVAEADGLNSTQLKPEE